MPLQTIFSTGVDIEDGGLNQAAFITIVFAIIVGWVLVSLYQRVLETFSYQTLGMNSRSTVHSIIIALVVTALFIFFVWMVDEYQIIPSSVAGEALAEAAAGLAGPGEENTVSNTLTTQLANTRRGNPVVIVPPLRYY